MTGQRTSIPSVSSFVAAMEKEGHFRRMDEEQRKILLWELYWTAVRRRLFEAVVQLNKKELLRLRGTRLRLTKTLSVLRPASEDITEALSGLTYMGDPSGYPINFREELRIRAVCRECIRVSIQRKALGLGCAHL